MSFEDYDDGWEPDYDISEQVPPGIYQAVIVELRAALHPIWNDDQARWVFKIHSGPDRGKILIKWSSLERSKRNYLVQDLFRCGIKIKNLPDLEGKRLALESRIVELKVDYKNSSKGTEYQVVWINSLIRGVEYAKPEARIAVGDPDEEVLF